MEAKSNGFVLTQSRRGRGAAESSFQTMCIDDNSVRLAGPLRLCAPLRLCVEKTQIRDAKTCISRRTDFLEIGVRLDFHHFHADASLGDVPVLSSSGAVALRSKNENRV